MKKKFWFSIQILPKHRTLVEEICAQASDDLESSDASSLERERIPKEEMKTLQVSDDLESSDTSSLISTAKSET